jgi:(E)-4-hydroxy-3-methylbut-2-enyl-diphosphate synthase
MRRKTRVIHVGDVPIGEDHPVVVQGMTKTHTSDVAATVGQAHAMIARGCRIIRVAVPRADDADAIASIRAQLGGVPIVADVHFDHLLAVRSLEAGAEGVRINPGNMRDTDAVAQVVRTARERDACIRIGVNSGSVRTRRGGEVDPDEVEEDLAGLLARRALEHLEFIESLDFTNVKLSLKASDVLTTLRANEAAAARCDVPFHIGITAAGPPRQALVQSAVGLGVLLERGIGDTIRVSMTGPPEDEITAACAILEALALRERTGVRIVSCPTCGRCDVDLVRTVDEVARRMPPDAPPVTVAVMGCVVNGPGEAADADVGLAGGKGFAFLFRRGHKVRRVSEDEMVDVLIDEVMKLKS